MTGTGKGDTHVDAGDEGTVQFYSETIFDGDSNRALSTTQYSSSDPASGLITSTTYSPEGQTTQILREAWNADGTGKVVFTTLTTYDDQGRVVFQADEHLAGETVYATKTLYDGAGRAYVSAPHGRCGHRD